MQTSAQTLWGSWCCNDRKQIMGLQWRQTGKLYCTFLPAMYHVSKLPGREHQNVYNAMYIGMMLLLDRSMCTAVANSLGRNIKIYSILSIGMMLFLWIRQCARPQCTSYWMVHASRETEDAILCRKPIVCKQYYPVMRGRVRAISVPLG